MAPGIGDLPAAEETAAAQRVGHFLARLPPRTLLAIRFVLHALEWSSFPRRLSRLPPEGRARILGRMEASRIGPRHDLALLAKLLFNLGYAAEPAVREAVGERAACAVEPETADATATGATGPAVASDTGGPGQATERAGAAPAKLQSSRPPLGESLECEIAIVGSGAGGAAAAAVLAEAGHDVVVLEAGGVYDASSYPAELTEALSTLYRDGGLTVATGRPAVTVPVGRAAGGTTVVNSGTCFRAPAEALAGWAGGEAGIGWATDLDAEFAEAEEFLQVTRLDPERMGRNGQLAMEGAERLGASGGPISRNAGRCVQCSSCPVGCRIDAKQGMHVSYLPRAIAAGARLHTGVEAVRLQANGDSEGTIECLVREAGAEHLPRQASGRPLQVRARRVILAGGALGTPELLLRSGLGGRQVGRNLHVHPASWIGARYPEPVRGWEGVMQSYYIDQWKDRGLLLEATFTPLAFGGAWLPGAGADHQRALLGFDRIGSIGVHLSDRSSGRVRLNGDGVALSYRLTRDDGERLYHGIARAAEIHFAAGAEEVYPNLPGLATLGPGDLAAFESARRPRSALRLEAFHPMGTARISQDPRRGVCRPDGSVYGAGDVYVADASLFPSSLGVNPMMTVIAFAKRIARDLSEA